MQAATQIPFAEHLDGPEPAPAADWKDAPAWRELTAPEPMPVTLLDLVTAVSEVADNEQEIVGTVAYMLSSGSVELSGSFRDEALGSLLAGT